MSPGPLSLRFSLYETSEIASRYSAGQSTPPLARDYAIAESALLQLLLDGGVLMRKQEMISTKAEQAGAPLYGGGMFIGEIVEQINCSYVSLPVRPDTDELDQAREEREAAVLAKLNQSWPLLTPISSCAFSRLVMR